MNLLDPIRRFGLLILSLSYFLASWDLDDMVLLLSNKCFIMGRSKFWIRRMVILLLSVVNIWNLLGGNPIFLAEFESFYFIYYFFSFCPMSICVLVVVLHLVLGFVVSDGFKILFGNGSLGMISSAFLMLTSTSLCSFLKIE